jgi:formamidopyrimidine-DNA glycosylase
MPEVCEITLLTEYLKSNIIDSSIISVKKHKIIVGKKNYTGLDLLSEKCQIKNVESKAKFMWITMDIHNSKKKLFMMVWFGLTGNFTLDNNSKSVRLEIELLKDNNIIQLCYNDQRMFGRIEVTNDINVLEKKVNSLAPDVLKFKYSDKIFYDMFVEYLKKHPKRENVKIVDLLLRQDVDDGIVSGIGNYLSAEILYRAKISPLRTLSSLSKEDIFAISHNCKVVTLLSYLHNDNKYSNGHKPNKNKYHTDIKLTEKKFVYNVYGEKKDSLGNEVQKKTIVTGRSTYWVPNVQI